MQTILHPWRALLIVPHDHVEEVGLWWLRLCIYQNHLMHHRGLLLRNHLHRGILFDDLLRHGSRCRGCVSVPFIIIILNLVTIILSCAVESYSSAIYMISSSRDWIIPSRVVFSSFSF
jgi:hypothetical protein